MWIDAPFENAKAMKPTKSPSIRVMPTKNAWKEIEQQRRECDQRKRLEPTIQFIRSELERITLATAALITSNEDNPLVSIQFFNFDANEKSSLHEMANKDYFNEKTRLEYQLAQQHQQIECIKRFMWEPYVVKPVKIHGIQHSIAVENYPLTELEKKIGNEQFLNDILSSEDLSAHFCRLRNQQRCLDGYNDIEWPVFEETRKCEKFSAIVTKVCDQHLNTSTTWNQNYLKFISADNRIVDIGDEHACNEHIIKIHVGTHKKTNIEEII